MAEAISFNARIETSFSLSLNISEGANVSGVRASIPDDRQRRAEGALEMLSQSGPNASDGVSVSIHARALNFMSSVLGNAGVSEPVIARTLGRFNQDPAMSQELQRLYLLMEPLYDKDPELKKSFEQLFARIAESMDRMTNGQAAASVAGISGAVSGAPQAAAAAPAQTPSPASVAPSARPDAGATSVASNVSVETSAQVTYELVVVEGKVRVVEKRVADPLVIDLDGDGFEISKAENGVSFDIDGDGSKEMTAMTEDGDGALALDRNGNGVIDDGRELFGDQNGAGSGFEELKKYDDNGDDKIDANDRIFDGLGILSFTRDTAGLLVQRLVSAKSLGIVSIDLSRLRNAAEIVNGSRITHEATIFGREGRELRIGEAFFENFKL